MSDIILHTVICILLWAYYTAFIYNGLYVLLTVDYRAWPKLNILGAFTAVNRMAAQTLKLLPALMGTDTSSYAMQHKIHGSDGRVEF